MPDFDRPQAEAVHDRTRRADLVLRNPPIDFCEVPHRLEQRADVGIIEPADIVSLRTKVLIARSKAAIELMPQKQPHQPQ